MDLRTATKLAGELVERWLKIIFAKENAGQFQFVQFPTNLFGVDKWRAKDFEWSRGAAAFRNVRSFN